MPTLRQTKYATELKRAEIPGKAYRIERLRIKSKGKEEIRFSWWPNGKMAPKPLDLSGDELIQLLEEAFKQGVFDPKFVKELKDMLARF